MEEERPDEMEMAEKENQETKKKECCKEMIVAIFSFFSLSLFKGLIGQFKAKALKRTIIYSFHQVNSNHLQYSWFFLTIKHVYLTI